MTPERKNFGLIIIDTKFSISKKKLFALPQIGYTGITHATLEPTLRDADNHYIESKTTHRFYCIINNLKHPTKYIIYDAMQKIIIATITDELNIATKLIEERIKDTP